MTTLRKFLARDAADSCRVVEAAARLLTTFPQQEPTTP